MFGEKVGEKVRVWLGNCWASSPTFLRHRATPAARAVEQLRLVTAELEMARLAPCRSLLTDAKRSVIGAADPTDIELFASLDQRLDRLATDLSCWANALTASACSSQRRPVTLTVVRASQRWSMADFPAAAATYVTPRERAALGRGARKGSPRSRHGDWQPSSTRPDPVDLVEEQASTRVPELVPIRYGRMLVSPFAFFRGAAAIMAADLAGTPDSGFRRSTVRRCPPVELRHLRHARAEVCLRHQRLRRDAPGTVGVGCQAARREPRGRCARKRVPAEAAHRDRRRRRLAPTERRCGSSPPSRTCRSGTHTSRSRA